MSRKVIVLVAVLAVASQAMAGLTLGIGDLRIKFINYDAATLYNGQSSYAYDGAAACDAGKIAQAANAYPLAAGFQGTDGLEDGWGILECSEIYNVNDPGTPLWQKSASEEITGMFYGLEDIYVKKVPIYPYTTIYGRDVKMDLYYDSTPDFDPSPGTGGRTGATTYPGTTNGQHLVSLLGTPGIFYGDAVPGGIPGVRAMDASWRASFDFDTSTGLGDLYADVVDVNGDGVMDSLDGAWAWTTDAGMVLSLVKKIPADTWVDLNANGFIDPGEFTLRDNPGTDDDGADWKFHWTAEPTAVADWLVLSNDPAATYSKIPEPATMSLVGLGLLALVRRRRRA